MTSNLPFANAQRDHVGYIPAVVQPIPRTLPLTDLGLHIGL